MHAGVSLPVKSCRLGKPCRPGKLYRCCKQGRAGKTGIYGNPGSTSRPGKHWHEFQGLASMGAVSSRVGLTSLASLADLAGLARLVSLPGLACPAGLGGLADLESLTWPSSSLQCQAFRLSCKWGGRMLYKSSETMLYSKILKGTLFWYTLYKNYIKKNL